MTITCPKCREERTSLDCGPCSAQKLLDMHDAQKRRADEAVELLRELQWSAEVLNISEDGIVLACPICSKPKSSKHGSKCRLAALIGKAGA